MFSCIGDATFSHSRQHKIPLCQNFQVDLRQNMYSLSLPSYRGCYLTSKCPITQTNSLKFSTESSKPSLQYYRCIILVTWLHIVSFYLPCYLTVNTLKITLQPVTHEVLMEQRQTYLANSPAENLKFSFSFCFLLRHYWKVSKISSKQFLSYSPYFI